MAANIFDIIIIVTLLGNMITGYLSGFIVQFSRIFSLVAAFWAMGQWTDALALKLGFIESPTWRAIASGVIIFFATLILVGLLAKILKNIVAFSHAGWLDKLCGAVAGLGVALIIWTLIILLLENLFPQAAFLRDSQVVPYFNMLLEQLRPWLPPNLAKFVA